MTIKLRSLREPQSGCRDQILIGPVILFPRARDNAMNITAPILKGVTHLAALPGDSVSSFLKMIGEATGLFDDSPTAGLAW